MKAIVYEQYGPPDVLQLKEVEKPTPKENEVLVKVHAASVNYIDYQILRGDSLLLRLTSGGLLKPRYKMLGDDIAGRVEAVGRNVRQFQAGDEAFGICNTGGFAEVSNVFLPGKENGKWGYHGYSYRTQDRGRFEEFKTRFYELQGWDPASGHPTGATLESLGLGYVADELEKSDKLGEDR